jgi:hypothetical protein
MLGVGVESAPSRDHAALHSAYVGIAARSEQLRRVAEGDEAFVGDPERVA